MDDALLGHGSIMLHPRGSRTSTIKPYSRLGNSPILYTKSFLGGLCDDKAVVNTNEFSGLNENRGVLFPVSIA